MNKLFLVWLTGLGIVIAGCVGMDSQEEGPTQQPGALTSVCNGKWELRRLRVSGEVVPLEEASSFTFLCNSEGQAMGKSGINTYRGALQITDSGQMLWDTDSFASTKKAGPPHLMEQESRYLRALSGTRQAFIKGGGGLLILRDVPGDIYLEYSKAKN